MRMYENDKYRLLFIKTEWRNLVREKVWLKAVILVTHSK